MGLDREDVIIRRRLVQKFKFVQEDMATLVAPKDEELSRFFSENAEDYLIPVRVSFSHVYFSPDRGGDAFGRAEAVLGRLRHKDPAPLRAPELSENSPLRVDWSMARLDLVDREFGGNFAGALELLPLDSWEGPIESGMGVHLVHLTHRETARLPEFEEVRGEVFRDYEFERKRRARERAYREIRSKYAIRIEESE